MENKSFDRRICAVKGTIKNMPCKARKFAKKKFSILKLRNGNLIFRKCSPKTQMKAFDFIAKLFLFFTGYSASALLAIIFAIPFGLRLLEHELGRWQHFGEAFYTTYIELFLGNACLGKSSPSPTLLTLSINCKRLKKEMN